MPRETGATKGWFECESPVVCEQAAMSRFEDDARGVCAVCGCEVAYRPYMPEEAPKLCVDCHGQRSAARSN